MSSTMSFNPNSLTEMFMNNIILNKLTSVMEKEFTFSAKNIIKILILLSISDIRNGANSIISIILNKLKLFPVLSLKLAMDMSKRLIHRRVYHNVSFVLPQINEYERTLNIEITDNFMQCLYRYLIKNADGNCSFKKTTNKIRIENTKNNSHFETFSDISITLGNIKVILNSNIDFNVNINELESRSCDIYLSNFKSYTDLLSPDQKYIVDRIHTDLIKTINYNDLMKLFDCDYKNGHYFSEFTIAKLISDKYGFNYIKTVVDILIITSLLMTATTKYSVILSNCKKSFEGDNVSTTIIYDSGQEYRYDVTDKEVNYACNDNIRNKFSVISWVNNYININGIRITPFTAFSQHRNNSCLSYLSLTLISTSEFDHIQTCQDFIRIITTLSRKITKKVNIMTISIKTKTTKILIDNPAYDEWKENIKLLQSSGVGEKEISLLKAPPKQITDEKVNKEILATKLNSSEKSIDTVYLRESDKFNLMTCIDQFKNKKDILRELGFQNKLNILLYGPPGTGKSTTITALASYFERDIYYVDLKEAKTNKDLQMIFEYANSNINNGGIIVFEDIDSMTSVVLDRGKTKEISVNELSKLADSELSLEYLLNVLQGTLTIDDSIVIVTTNHIDHLDPAFYRDGRFDIKIELKLCDHHQISTIYEKMLNRRLSKDILMKIEENKYSPATVIYHIKNYIFKTDATDEEIMKKFISL